MKEWYPKKCVIVPIDFSPASDHAVRTALSVVDSPRHVHVVHVVTIPEVIPYGEFAWVVEPKEWIERATMHLGQYVASHPEFRDVTFATLTGEPGIGIVQYAEQHHADLIVMPCHGVRGINKRLLGSVTTEVLKHAPCDVLVQRFAK